MHPDIDEVTKNIVNINYIRTAPVFTLTLLFT